MAEDDRNPINIKKEGRDPGERIFAAASLLVLAASLLPVVLAARYSYATGDDLGYSVYLHDVMLEGGGVLRALQAVLGHVRHMYYAYQGTWSSIILFQLQPGIFGEHFYGLTAWISLAFVIGGTGLFLYRLLVKELGLSRAFWLAVLSLSMTVTVQYMPKPRGGIFWYTSVAHYCIPYGVALWGAAAALRWMRGGAKRTLVLLCVLFAYLGGAGYPPVILGLLLVLIAAAYGVSGIHTYGESRAVAAKRAWFLLLPEALLIAGLAVSAAAPGNKVRGGESFGLSGSGGVLAILLSLRQGMADAARYLLEVRALWFVMLLVFLLALAFAGRGKERKHPWLFILLGYLLVCAVRTPAIYAGVEVSGGVPDVEWFVFVLMLMLQEIAAAGMIRKRLAAAGREASFLRTVRRFVLPGVFALTALVWLFGYRHLVGGSVDYQIYEFAQSGALADYVDQMEERLALLSSPETDLVVPEMNDEQGPFMHMALTEDPDSFANRVTARYYHKNSIVAVDRKTYEEEFGGPASGGKEDVP